MSRQSAAYFGASTPAWTTIAAARLHIEQSERLVVVTAWYVAV
jgi:hypothetical protein